MPNTSLDRRKTAGPVGLAFFLLFLPLLCFGQQYEISGESSLTGVFTLNIYDGDSTMHSFTNKANKGMFFFSGAVERPVLASIEHPTMSQPLFFYLDGSEISIHVNATRPEASVIKGSRSNSEYRYMMERLNNASDPNAFLRQQLKDTPGSIFLPFILYRQLSNLDEGTLRQLIGQIAGEAKHTYHYTLLQRWLRQTPIVAEGCEMPDFAFLNSKKERCTFAQSRNADGYTLILFSATWCDRCKQLEEEAASLFAEQDVDILTINIDDNPNGWDAHYLQQLSVNHIPYLIMVDPEGLVTARDIRSWELYRLRSKK